MAEERREGAALRERAAESVVGVLRDGVAVGIEIARDVADVVIVGDIRHAIDGQVQQASDAACALQRAGKIFAPEVADRRCCAIRVGNAFLHKVPPVVEEGCGGFRRNFLHSAGFRVVEVGDEQHAI